MKLSSEMITRLLSFDIDKDYTKGDEYIHEKNYYAGYTCYDSVQLQSA